MCSEMFLTFGINYHTYTYNKKQLQNKSAALNSFK